MATCSPGEAGINTLSPPFASTVQSRDAARIHTARRERRAIGLLYWCGSSRTWRELQVGVSAASEQFQPLNAGGVLERHYGRDPRGAMASEHALAAVLYTAAAVRTKNLTCMQESKFVLPPRAGRDAVA